MDHEFGRQVSAGGGDDRGADDEFGVQLEVTLKLGPAHLLQAAQRRRRGLELSGGGTDDRVACHEREVVHDHPHHRAAASRERRYRRAAS